MMTRIKETKPSNRKSEANSGDNIADAADFHAERITSKSTTERLRAFGNKPTGNDEIEQSIAEDADLKKIAETAYLIAQTRQFAPGKERSDWLKAESKVEDVLKTEFIDRRDGAIPDRRTAGTPNRRVSAGEQRG